MAAPSRRAFAAAVAAVMVLAWYAFVPAQAAFTSTISNTGNSYAAGTDFSINGALYVWGDNGGVQITPSRIGTASTWTSATVADRTACGISGGKLFCLGANNGSGQQGVNDNAAHYTATQVGSADWTGVAAGSSHACGVQSGGTLWCWGSNNVGQLAQDTSTTSARTPTQVVLPAPTGWSSVSAGREFTCATRTDGTLYCWGSNSAGQLGVGPTPASSSTPLLVTGTGWTSVALGYGHACGLRGTALYCWGDGGGNRLGQSDNNSSSTPLPVTGSWSSVTAGQDHTCGINGTSQLYCWGAGGSGRLGRGTTAGTSTGPALVGSAATTWRSVSAGQAHTCATRTDDSLWCWGSNTYGQVGDASGTDQLSPVRIGASVWSTTAPGALTGQTCAVRTDGSLWCWGQTGLPLFLPTQIGTATTWHSAAVGNQFACGIRDAGALYCFGRQAGGRLGTGDNADHFAPAPVTTTAGTAFNQVTLGDVHGCAVGTDTTLWCWGSASYGQTGQGDTTQRNSPVQVTVPAATGWAAVSAGALYSCATRTDTTMYCWGQNAFGEIGQGVTGPPFSTPTQVTTPAPTGWVQVSAGFQHVCALRDDTQIYCWASGGSGRLGHGVTPPPAFSPTAVVDTGGYVWVGLGTDHSCAIKGNGTLWCWGTGWNGRLGNGTANDKYVPTQTTGSSAWRKVSGGRPNTCGVRADNSVWCWGSNALGQLGLGSSYGDQLTPVRIALTGRPVAGGPASNMMSLISY